MASGRLFFLALATLLLPGISQAEEPSKCPGGAYGDRWFAYVFACDRVIKDFVPPPPHSTSSVPENAREARYEHSDDGFVVRLLPRAEPFTGFAGTPNPDWARLEEVVWRFRKVDRCTLEANWSWPRRIYLDAHGCKTPYDAYAWAPGAPDEVSMAKALYVGRLVDGRLELSRDPRAGLHDRGVPVLLQDAPKQWYGRTLRFVGDEPRGLVGGRRLVRMRALSPSSAVDVHVSDREFGTDVANLALAAARAGRREDFFWLSSLVLAAARTGAANDPEAMLLVDQTAQALEGLRARDEADELEWDRLWRPVGLLVSNIVWKVPTGPEVRRAGQAIRIVRRAGDVSFELPTPDGMREAERARRVGLSVDARTALLQTESGRWRNVRF